MNRRWVFFVSALAAVCCGGKVEARELNVFLFAGQSNMAGADSLIRGGRAGFAETPADRNSLFTYAPGPGDERSPAYYPWGPIRGYALPSGANPKGYVHGPEVGFARQLYARGLRNLAIIKVSDNIAHEERTWLWSPGERYYRSWKKFADRRLAELEKMGHTYEVCGFVWHQGIDEGFHRERSAEYEKNLTRLIAQLREAYGCPKAPFILARSVKSKATNRAYMERVRQAQVHVAEADPHAAWINVDDQPNIVTHHFPASAQLVLGKRFADAYLGMAGTSTRKQP